MNTPNTRRTGPPPRTGEESALVDRVLYATVPADVREAAQKRLAADAAASKDTLNPTPTGDRCDVCGDRATEIARGVYWRHPRCVRRVAAVGLAEEMWLRFLIADVIEDNKKRAGVPS